MFEPIIAMPPPEYYRDAKIALLILFSLAFVFLRATSSGRKVERGRRMKLALLAFLSSPALATLSAGLVQALGGVSPLDVAHLYSSFIGIGVLAGSILGLFFAATSLLCLNGPESSPRNLNP